MSKQTYSHFVWARGVAGPAPQKWRDKPSRSQNHQDYWRVNLLASVQLDEEESKLSLDDLARRYPAPPEHAWPTGEV